jgi:hypothetical protein
MKSCFASSVRFHKSVQCSQDRCDGVVSDRFFCTTSINVLVSKLYMVHGRYKEQRALTYLDTPQWHSPQNYFLSQFRCPLNFCLDDDDLSFERHDYSSLRDGAWLLVS